MTNRLAPCAGASPTGRIFWLAILAMALAFAPRATVAQVTFAVWENQYEAALTDYEARAAEFRSAFQLSEVALDQVEIAQGTPQYEAALARYQTSALNVMTAQATAAAAADRLAGARATFLAVLQARDAEILAALGTIPPAGRGALLAEWQEVGSRRNELEAAGPMVEEQLAVRPAPELTVSPRDTPRELSFKAVFMEDRAAQYDLVILSIDGQIAQIEVQILQMRNTADLLQGIARFDSDLSLGGQLGTDAAAQAPAAGTEPSSVAGRSLPERLQIWQDLRAQTEQYRDRASAQAQIFRELASGAGP